VKALVLKDALRFEYEDVPEPILGDDEVLIRVRACGICGSDVHGMDGSTGRRRPPIVMGHEASGVIARLGRNVQGFSQGDRVTFDSTVYCGDCWFCRRGQINLCENRRVLGVSCEEYRRHGAFADYVAVPQRILYRLPEKVSFEQAAMIEALSIAFHAVCRSGVTINDTAVVVGAGMIGLLVVQTLRLAGCGTIIAVDLDEGKLSLAKKLGADVAFNPAACDVTAETARLTDGRGADLAFEVVGMGPSLQTAVGSLRKGGRLTLVGNLSPQVPLPLQAVVTRELTLLGSCSSCGEYPACLAMLARGTVNVDALITAVAPLADGPQWFDRLYHKEPGLLKVILQP
jgi:L-iditol 2-dehydrogenase